MFHGSLMECGILSVVYSMNSKSALYFEFVLCVSLILIFFSTLAKFTLCGSDYMPTLLKDINFECIPESLGGGFKLYNEPYEFNLQSSGPLFYSGCLEDAKKYQYDDSNSSISTHFETSEPMHNITTANQTNAILEESALEVDRRNQSFFHKVSHLPEYSEISAEVNKNSNDEQHLSEVPQHKEKDALVQGEFFHIYGAGSVSDCNLILRFKGLISEFFMFCKHEKPLQNCLIVMTFIFILLFNELLARKLFVNFILVFIFLFLFVWIYPPFCHFILSLSHSKKD